MKKLLIVTIQSENYGNRLQNYALQEFLKSKHFDVYSAIGRKQNIQKKIKEKIRVLLKKDKHTNFVLFNKNVHYSNDIVSYDELHINNFDALIVGSDQIWNTTFKWLSKNVFLPISHPRKISFAASFGVDSIPYDQEIADCLNNFKALSVREESGAKIIKELTGRDASVLVDPTMLLTPDEWRKVSKKPKAAKEGGYILTYFLSPKCSDAEYKLAEIRGNKEVYELLNLSDPVAGTAGPSEFLWLFEHADLILTDSFHACVFSFLFNKPFIVYDRNWNEGNMNSRIETLLSKFHLERKYANSGLPNDLWEHDYSIGYKQLEIERKKAIDFLKVAMKEE